MESTAILLIGHGSRSQPGTQEFLELVPQLADRYPEMQVAPGFLELQQPTIADAVAGLGQSGIQKIAVAPVLLFAAGHARRDIPVAVSAALKSFPQIQTAQMPALDCEASLVQLSRLRRQQVCETPSPTPDTLLVLVGRGSNDATATAKMHEFAALRAAADGLQTRVGFLAMAEPGVRDVLEQAASEPWSRVIVQPHLLFQGELLQELQQAVTEFKLRHPHKQWIMTAHLAANLAQDTLARELLLDAVCSRLELPLAALNGKQVVCSPSLEGRP